MRLLVEIFVAYMDEICNGNFAMEMNQTCEDMENAVCLTLACIQTLYYFEVAHQSCVLTLGPGIRLQPVGLYVATSLHCRAMRPELSVQARPCVPQGQGSLFLPLARC